MDALGALAAVGGLAVVGFMGGQVEALRPLFGVVLPYAALLAFLAGMTTRVLRWAASPVPFRIPTTCGQQRSLAGIRPSRLESPSSTLGVVGRMAGEVLLFRSLFRNTEATLTEGPRLVYAERRILWLSALAFHWTLLVVVLRHLRFFLEPVPAAVEALALVDGFFQVGAPVLYATDVVLLAAMGYLLGRRVLDPQVRYISLFADYFAIFLLLAIAISGVVMRYFIRIDAVAVKRWAIGLTTFAPVVPAEVGTAFFVHLFLVTVLLGYFPASKLVHMGGVFLSPTRNLANTSRTARHVNPWNAPVPVHSYADWEDEFREKIKAAGLPLEKE